MYNVDKPIALAKGYLHIANIMDIFVILYSTPNISMTTREIVIAIASYMRTQKVCLV